ncbi:MAG: hypothetical protein RL134_2557 [Actinomycetota bacterium]|jgi:hypothetical protein
MGERYRLTGDYGTFSIRRVVEVSDIEDAWAETGICTTLVADGWEIVEWPDGEEWTAELWQDGAWVEVEL